MKRLVFWLVLLGLGCRDAGAHVKWFVQKNDVAQLDVTPFSLSEPLVMGVMAFGVTLVLIAVGLNWLLGRNGVSANPLTTAQTWRVVRLVQVLFGLSVLLSAVKGALFVPHLHPDVIRSELLLIEAVAGILMLSGHFVLTGALLITGLLCFLWIDFGVVTGFEYFNLYGLTFVMALTALGGGMLRHHEVPAAHLRVGLVVLRVTLGVALIVLGLSEKLLNPQLAMAFLLRFEEVNFVRAMFEGFSHREFILCCGVVEVVFGVNFLLGVVTRLNTFGLAVFLILSNSYFAFAGNAGAALMELIGHLPLLATALLLVLYGRGASYRECLVLLHRIPVALNTDDRLESVGG